LLTARRLSINICGIKKVKEERSQGRAKEGGWSEERGKC
jgi:hypothetical protein